MSLLSQKHFNRLSKRNVSMMENHELKILNMFIKSSSFDFVISVVSVLIFIGFTAYDVQRVLRLYDNNVLPEENLAIYGALQLYLDFINLFIRLIEFFGKRNDN